MALVLKDRVKETTTTTGTGTITLAGASSGFQSFSAIGNANTTYYTIAGGTEWEVGLGTYTSSGNTLSRDTVLESSNGGSLVNFSAGTKDIFITYPADKSIYDNNSGSIIASGILPTSNGGTGLSTYATGDLIYASATNTLSKLTAGTNGYVLTLSSGVPTWSASGGGSMVYPGAGIAVSTGSAWTTSLTAPSGTIVGTTDSQALTNKTISGASNTISNIGLSTQVTGTLPVANGGTGATTLTGVIKGNGTSAITAATAGTDYVAPATATTFTATQTFTGSTTALAAVFQDAAEVITISATAATGTINYDVTTQSVLYYTTDASANWTVNIRGNGTTSLNTLMSTGQALTVVFLVTQGATAYYNNALQIDGSSITPKYQDGTAFISGNVSGIDAYSYTIVKTGSAAFTVLAAKTQFK
jgi:hypothetical protein